MSVDVTRGSRSVQASASCASGWHALGEVVQRADLREHLGRDLRRLEEDAGLAGARILRDTREVTVRQQPLCERRERDAAKRSNFRRAPAATPAQPSSSNMLYFG